MHIFQCIRVPSQEVAQDLHHYIKGNYHKVRGGMRDNGHGGHGPTAAYYGGNPPLPARGAGGGRGAAAAGGNQTVAEFFEMDVNTLNRCFDDIERFVARIQSAAIAQR